MLYARTRNHLRCTSDMCAFPLYFEKHFSMELFFIIHIEKWKHYKRTETLRNKCPLTWVCFFFFSPRFLWLAYFCLCHVKRLNFQFLLHFVFFFPLLQLAFEMNASKRFRTTHRDENYNVEESTAERCTWFFFFSWVENCGKEWIFNVDMKQAHIRRRKKKSKRTQQAWVDMNRPIKIGSARAHCYTRRLVCIVFLDIFTVAFCLRKIELRFIGNRARIHNIFIIKECIMSLIGRKKKWEKKRTYTRTHTHTISSTRKCVYSIHKPWKKARPKKLIITLDNYELQFGSCIAFT